MGKKTKIKKLTDEQYLAYITGLKEGSYDRGGNDTPTTVGQEQPAVSKDD